MVSVGVATNICPLHVCMQHGGQCLGLAPGSIGLMYVLQHIGHCWGAACLFSLHVCVYHGSRCLGCYLLNLLASQDTYHHERVISKMVYFVLLPRHHSRTSEYLC